MKELNVPFQIKVPADVALALNVRYTELRNEYDKALDTLNKKIALGRGVEKLQAERKRLITCGRTLSLSNLLRAAIVDGHTAIMKLKTDALLDKLAQDGLTRGRPRDVAA